jgi:hypothetical protein
MVHRKTGGLQPLNDERSDLSVIFNKQDAHRKTSAFGERKTGLSGED